MKNKTVTVSQYGGKIVEKILVEDLGDVILVTSHNEWELSQRESRPPVVVGFRKEYVVEESRKRE